MDGAGVGKNGGTEVGAVPGSMAVAAAVAGAVAVAVAGAVAIAGAGAVAVALLGVDGAGGKPDLSPLLQRKLTSWRRARRRTCWSGTRSRISFLSIQL